MIRCSQSEVQISFQVVEMRQSEVHFLEKCCLTPVYVRKLQMHYTDLFVAKITLISTQDVRR